MNIITLVVIVVLVLVNAVLMAGMGYHVGYEAAEKEQSLRDVEIILAFLSAYSEKKEDKEDSGTASDSAEEKES